MITIVGGLPEPIGGVTTFVKRLVFNLAADSRCLVEVLDLYPQRGKIVAPPDVRHTLAPANKVLKLLWLLWHVLGKHTVHFNFSTPTSIYLFLVLPKWRSRWILTLHHGQLANIDSALLRRVWPIVVRRLDQVVALSALQREYYERVGVPSSRLFLGGSYVRPVVAESPPSADAKAVIQRLRSRYQTLVFASGSPATAYRHRELIAAFSRAAQARDACLLLCLYGNDAENLRSTIMDDVRAADACITTIGGLDEASFNYVLQNCDLYVRANSIDSCGIALFDAVSFGVRVLASDVCRRPPGAMLFETGNYADLEAKLRDLLHQQEADEPITIAFPDDLDFYDGLYNDTPRIAA